MTELTNDKSIKIYAHTSMCMRRYTQTHFFCLSKKDTWQHDVHTCMTTSMLPNFRPIASTFAVNYLLSHQTLIPTRALLTQEAFEASSPEVINKVSSTEETCPSARHAFAFINYCSVSPTDREPFRASESSF